MLEALKERVWRAHLKLLEARLVIQTEGNVSERSPNGEYFVIKPSGVAYPVLKPEDLVVLDMEGRVCEGRYRPSTDTPTHLEIYRSRPDIGGIAHTHSPYATAWAQGLEPIPCYGTTHADAFGTDVPLTRQLTQEEVREAYEKNTGKVILEVLGPKATAVLVAGHAPFTFGKDGMEAVAHAEILEKVALMALWKPPRESLAEHVRLKHFERKHGAGQYYGQEKAGV